VDLADPDLALVELLGRLDELGYEFVTPTPATHRRVLARSCQDEALTLRDIFGWSRPFRRETIRADLFDLLVRGQALSGEGGLWRSRLRVSRVAGRLFAHSAYPTDQADSVFLGPDTYRFVRFIASHAQRVEGARRVVDMGAGAGVGGIVLLGIAREAKVTLVDANQEALRLARINAAAAGTHVETILADKLAGVEGAFDLVIANPPFIMDEGGPAYRDGGEMLGARLSYDWAMEAARRLPPGGSMLLYTGSAIVAGRDALREALEEGLAPLGCVLDYQEIDPDIFGEQLDQPAYACVERIAAVGAVVTRPGA
jgi:hypothetical protein